MAEPELPFARYERKDVTFRFLATGFACMLVAILLCALLAMWIYPRSVVDRRLGSALPEYPAPRLQSDPTADLHRLLDAQMAQLNSAGWVDRQGGIAHIPIDDAMKRIAQQGIPDWPANGDRK